MSTMSLKPPTARILARFCFCSSVRVAIGLVTPVHSSTRAFNSSSVPSTLSSTNLDLLDRQVASERDVVLEERLSVVDEAVATLDAACERISEAQDIKTALSWEAKAAAVYWQCWRSLPIAFARQDEAKIPGGWRVFGERRSALSHSPRVATTPAGAPSGRSPNARLRTNASAPGLADRARFVVANLFAATPQSVAGLGRLDRVLIDPPREGAIEVVKALPARDDDGGLARIVYVSCNPATLARDAEVLVHERGYRIAAAGVVNMFPHTAHVESIALFEK
jgi:hypothetical protein